MKDLTKRIFAAMTFAAIAIGTSSCIYDAPGDKFYRTLWKSSPEALAPYSNSEITVEFLCENMITVKEGATIIAYGNYSFDDDIAVFSNLQAVIEGHEINFIEAYRNGDTLLLQWSADLIQSPFTISLKRLSAYE